MVVHGIINFGTSPLAQLADLNCFPIAAGLCPAASETKTQDSQCFARAAEHGFLWTHSSVLWFVLCLDFLPKNVKLWCSQGLPQERLARKIWELAEKAAQNSAAEKSGFGVRHFEPEPKYWLETVCKNKEMANGNVTVVSNEWLHHHLMPWKNILGAVFFSNGFHTCDKG